MNNTNPMQIIGNMMKSGGNPQAMIMNMLKSNMGNNPMMKNIYQMAQSKDAESLEKFARNLAKEKGIDVEQGIQQIKDSMGL